MREQVLGWFELCSG